MKILKKGRKTKKEINISCKKCDCIFSIGFRDYRVKSISLEKYVICPNCGNWISLENLTKEEQKIISSSKGIII